MRKLSYWAKHYPVHARVIIVFSHCLLIYLGYFLGVQLLKIDIALSPLWLYFLIAIFFAAGATYPSKRWGSYAKRKTYDLIVACCSFLMVLCVSNQLNAPVGISGTVQATTVINPSPYKYAEAKKLLEQFKNGEKTKFTSKEKRIIRKEFNYQLLQYAKAKVTGDKSNAETALLILLACIAAAGLFVLLAALACNISCNGSEAAALILFIFGTAAIIWGTVKVIRAIERRRSKTK